MQLTPTTSLPSLKLTACTQKWMVGIRSFPIGFRPIFRGENAVSFRECRIKTPTGSRIHAHRSYPQSTHRIVLVIGGRDSITPLEGKDYTWYINWYILPIGGWTMLPTFYKNLKNPFINWPRIGHTSVLQLRSNPNPWLT